MFVFEVAMSKPRDRAPFMSKSQSNGRLWLVISWNVLITQPKRTSQHEYVLCTSAYVGHMLCWRRLIMLDVCLLSHRTTKCLRSNFLKSNVWCTYIVIPIFVQYIHLLRCSLHWSCLEVSAMQRSGVRLSVRLSFKRMNIWQNSAKLISTVQHVSLISDHTLSVIGVGVSAICDFQSELRVNNRPLMPHSINLWTNFDANSHATSKKILLPVCPDWK